MKAERFTVVVLDGHKGPGFEIPFDPAQRWAVAQVKLWPGRRGYRGRSLRFFVLVTDDMAKAAKLQIGSKVEVPLLPAAGTPD